MPMPDHAQLPHLLRLFDDDSRLVRDAALDTLAEFGPELDQALASCPAPLSEARVQQMRRALAEYRARVRDFHADGPAGAVIGAALFAPGALVRHRRYDYRGVVVEYDLTCNASERWYTSNRTQPDRQQPWYHVLVHGSEAITYAAQSSLLPDRSREEVRHALVVHFFDQFEDGRYQRNGLPFPDVSDERR